MRTQLRSRQEISVSDAMVRIECEGRFSRSFLVHLLFDEFLKDLEQIEEYGLDITTLHWRAGASLATPWYIVQGGNLEGSGATYV